MKTLKTNLLLVLTIFFFNFSWAQEGNLPDEPMSSVDFAAPYVLQTIITAARQMPEDYYTFRPTAEVRSFGELMAHIAESNFIMTAIAKGEASPVIEVVPTKAEVIKALEISADYYAKARSQMSKERKKEVVKFMGNEHTAGNVLDFLIFHSLQHYGNVIVYMRLKGLIPPSSQEEPGDEAVPVKTVQE